MKIPEIQLPLNLKNRLSQGHPWVYRNQLGVLPKLEMGSWVQVRCGGFSAYGLWDNLSPIAVRLFSAKQVPDAQWLQEMVAQAWQNRLSLRNEEADTNAYRWIFGEGDGLPGLTVDLYDRWAVVRCYSPSVEVLKPWLVEALRQVNPALKGILERRTVGSTPATNVTPANNDLGLTGIAEDDAPAKIQVWWGSQPPRNLIVSEHGLQFQANLFEGQKTGLFLDHRENRFFLEKWCREYSVKSVLNCFSYTGAFSVYAARGGATQITSCDIAAQASAAAVQNFQLNDFTSKQHQFLSEDCFELLTRYGQEGRKFDLIVLDPPSFAKSNKHVHAALRGYSKLNQLALKCLKPHGFLASASCTSYVSPDMFRDMLAGVGQAASKRLQILHDAGQPVDHPVPTYFLEGRYLKFMLCRVHPVS
jgi:23S rRNA (cytosine1962-C5)-methyltransferase